jgi:hypothetical protein
MSPYIGHHELLEIMAITNQTHAQKLHSKAKFTSPEGCASCQSQAGKHTEQGIHSVFLSLTSLPLTLIDRFGFTVFVIGYLEKRAWWVRENKKILLGNIHL